MRHGLLARHDLTAQASTFRSRGKGRATGPHTASPVEVCGAGWAHVIGLCMRVARRTPVPPLRRSAPCVCRAAVLRSPVPLAATRNGPLCVCVPCSPAHTVGVQLVRKGPLELGAGGGAARAPQAAVSAAAHHRVRDRRAEGERRAARLGAGARRGRSTRCVRGGVHFQRTTLTYSPQSQPAGLRMELGQRLGGPNPSRGVYQRRVRSECGPNAATQAMCGPSASISGEGKLSKERKRWSE